MIVYYKGQHRGGAGQTGWAGNQQTETMLLSESYPARLQEVPLATNTVLYVDQTQQVLLKHKERKEQKDRETKRDAKIRETMKERYSGFPVNLQTIFMTPFVFRYCYHLDQAGMSFIVLFRMSQAFSLDKSS